MRSSYSRMAGPWTGSLFPTPTPETRKEALYGRETQCAPTSMILRHSEVYVCNFSIAASKGVQGMQI